jgi:hypothetical protein
MNPFCTFMASGTGRILRIFIGLAVMIWALLGLDDTTQLVVAAIGAVPLVAGAFDFCLFAPLFGCPMSGPQIRAGR